MLHLRFCLGSIKHCYPYCLGLSVKRSSSDCSPPATNLTASIESAEASCRLCSHSRMVLVVVLVVVILGASILMSIPKIYSVHGERVVAYGYYPHGQILTFAALPDF